MLVLSALQALQGLAVVPQTKLRVAEHRSRPVGAIEVILGGGELKGGFGLPQRQTIFHRIPSGANVARQAVAPARRRLAKLGQPGGRAN